MEGRPALHGNHAMVKLPQDGFFKAAEYFHSLQYPVRRLDPLPRNADLRKNET